jgi:hypothetical protein
MFAEEEGGRQEPNRESFQKFGGRFRVREENINVVDCKPRGQTVITHRRTCFLGLAGALVILPKRRESL